MFSSKLSARAFMSTVSLSVLLVLLVSQSGCTRRFFRNCADKEVHAILADKDRYPFWKIENYHVYPHPEARFANPTNPDCPPMPPDDQAAKYLSPNPQHPGKAGIAYLEGDGYLHLLAQWDAMNRARLQSAKVARGQSPEEDDNTTGQTYQSEGNATKELQEEVAPETKGYLITLDQAIELGLINSREYQNRREDLYLTALPVTLQRFGFAPQFFFTEQAIREKFGSNAPAGPVNRWRFESATGVAKLFSTGALLVAQFANQTIINLTGDAPHTVSVSDINLDLVQPLLRGGGKAVTLEALTQTERNLVYEIRDYARFRKQFFVSVAGGDNVPGSGGRFSGLGASITPGSGLGISGLEVLPGSAGSVILNTGLLANGQGYLPTLLIAARLENEKKNVEALKLNLGVFEFFFKASRIEELQVNQVKTDLLNSENQVLALNRDLQDALDQFKIQLGLPPHVKLELDDSPIRPITEHLVRYEKLYDEEQKALDKASALILPITKDFYTRGQSDEEKHLGLRKQFVELLTNAALVKGTQLEKSIVERLDKWATPKKISTDQLKGELGQELRLNLLTQSLEPSRTGTLTKSINELEIEKDEAEDKGGTWSEKKQETLDALIRERNEKQFELALREYEALWPNIKKQQPGESDKNFKERERQFREQQPGEIDLIYLIRKMRYRVNLVRQHYIAFKRLESAWDDLLDEATQERLTKLLNSWPELPPLFLDGVNLREVPQDKALESVATTAKTFRLDLMNERAEVVDAWRQLALQANALLGVFNVRYHFDVSTPPDLAQPFGFNGGRSRHQLFLNFELPLVRKAERNAYRASLIGFERARRVYMAAQDNVELTVRTEIRQLRQLAENYKIQKLVVHLAYPQVDNSREQLLAVDPEQRLTSAGNAALTNTLLSRQASLVRSQNEIYGIYIQYIIARLQLYRDLELMPLDPRGVWIDEYACQSQGNAAGSDDSNSGVEELPPPARVLPPAKASIRWQEEEIGQ